MKNKPQRMCMGCNNKTDKNNLIRIVLNKDGEITIDKTGKLSGRGAYICDSLQCLEKIIKTKKLERTFNIQIETEIYDKLRGVIIDNRN